uniref:Uncharacterized protein n=1 Tax=Glossina pallidipes TaxID=7398 RepID=A0A1B0A9T0_GLOPL
MKPDYLASDLETLIKVDVRTTYQSVCKPACKGLHCLFRCDQFLQADVNKRHEVAHSARLYCNYLSTKYKVKECLAHSGWKKCEDEHNTLLRMAASINEQREANPTHASSCITVTVNIGLLQATIAVYRCDQFLEADVKEPGKVVQQRGYATIA